MPRASEDVLCQICGATMPVRRIMSHTRMYFVPVSSDHQHHDNANDGVNDDAPPAPQLDDIKIEYHPHSKIPSTVHPFSDFSCHHPTEDTMPRHASPWEPFCTRLDFEVAEIALAAAMTKDQTNRLFELMRRAASAKEDFTLQSHDEVCTLWKMASERFTPFETSTISVPHHGEAREYTMYSRCLWNWALDLMQDIRFAPHFVFDAQRLYKFNGARFVQFIDEPWAANAFWDAQLQSRLPPDAKPLVFILYADKAKLSSFGTDGYPIVVRIANLPVEIRNGTGVGGGRVVGWLPIQKKSFVNFKNAVWHGSFLKLLKAVIVHSKSGYWFECWDHVQRLLWPLILILSADYEAQCVMSLIRRLKGKFPCPVCLVPQEQQAVLSDAHPLRTSTQSLGILNAARSTLTEKEKEKQLKAYSLRDVENCFWKVSHCDVHRALSFDRLHSNNAGMWGDHLWSELHFDALPRWRDLKHFLQVVGVDFNDGSAHEDISKMIIFTAQNVLSRTNSELGYLLLRCICCYVDLDIYAALEVHTEDTTAAGRDALSRFSMLMDLYIEKSQPETRKSWNFPKKHLLTHLFDNILAKGVTRNYNTKVNEKMHGPLRAIYLQWTNFRDVAPQILRYDHWQLTSTSIRDEINDLDVYTDNLKAAIEPEATNNPEDVVNAARVQLGARQGDFSFSAIEQTHATDRAFFGFRIKLNKFFNDLLLNDAIPLPNETCSRFQACDQSMVDWRLQRDLLQCNPKFFGSPRYDCIIIKTEHQPLFAHLIYMFRCKVGGTELSLALIHPYDIGIGVCRRQDLDLGLWSVRAKPQSSSEFIFVESIIRGVALASDPEAVNDYFVMDTIDTDMFLRMKALQGSSGLHFQRQ
ncbi:uncharacterized protein F5891DRAFT_1128092 [Suillus fuscotomentosus]|uniref:Transposase n=1 Tax=Suillus fuscotomentosus TaxID=1912939 RepID=A0AAD4HN37_9AGAM|nr:uncharacterized protein F5891DRAFT_1128092 [Suillus fuscotomentosus]KAG1901334.1 hypothetical protein F5891DRAFT_1128092 [Suillus fuscotomentosus]